MRSSIGAAGSEVISQVTARLLDGANRRIGLNDMTVGGLLISR